jgi:hypothetical protein
MNVSAIFVLFLQIKVSNYSSYRLRSKLKCVLADTAGSVGSAAHASTVEV